MRNDDFFDDFKTTFDGVEILRIDQVHGFIRKSKGVTTSKSLDNNLKLLISNGYLTHAGLNKWRNMTSQPVKQEKLVSREERLRNHHKDQRQRHWNDDIVRNYYNNHKHEPIDPEACPPGIKRIIETGNLSDHVKKLIKKEMIR